MMASSKKTIRTVVLAAIAAVLLVGAGVMIWAILAFAVMPQIVYHQTQVFCGGVPMGTTRSAFKRLLEVNDMAVSTGRASATGDGETEFNISGARLYGFCRFSCDGKFSPQGRLVSAEADGFCD